MTFRELSGTRGGQLKSISAACHLHSDRPMLCHMRGQLRAIGRHAAGWHQNDFTTLFNQGNHFAAMR